MATRREILCGPAGLAMIALFAGSAGAAPKMGGRVVPRLLVADMRFGEGRAFGEAAARSGFEVVRLSGDVSALWYRLRRPSGGGAFAGAIAGLTAYDMFFCIEQFARDAGLHVRMRVDHQTDADGGVKHLPIGSGTPVEYLDSLYRAGGAYPFAVATGTPSLEPAHPGVPMSLPVAQAGDTPETMVSWIITSSSSI